MLGFGVDSCKGRRFIQTSVEKVGRRCRRSQVRDRCQVSCSTPPTGDVSRYTCISSQALVSSFSLLNNFFSGDLSSFSQILCCFSLLSMFSIFSGVWALWRPGTRSLHTKAVRPARDFFNFDSALPLRGYTWQTA